VGSMTMRDRMLAVVRGERPLDRVPFVQYDGAGGPTAEAWDLLGRQNMGVLQWTGVHRTEAPGCRFEVEEIEHAGRRGVRTTLYTPTGRLYCEHTYQPDLGALAVRKHYVAKPQDYEILMTYLRSIVVHEDYDRAASVARDLGDDGLPHVSIDRTPWQQLWIQWVCLEDLCLHVADCPDVVEECLDIIGGIVRRTFKIVAKADIPYVVFPDNITAPAIGERYFRQYCLPFYRELHDMLAERGIPVFVHIDGDTRGLRDAIGESGIDGIDSLSPPPDNDTSVEEALRLWPGIRLLVNFPSSVHLAPAERIYEVAADIVRQAGDTGRVQIQISENVPPGAWRKSYPEIVRATRDAVRWGGPAGKGGG